MRLFRKWINFIDFLFCPPVEPPVWVYVALAFYYAGCVVFCLWFLNLAFERFTK